MKTISFILLTLLPVSLWAASFKVVDVKGSPFFRAAGSLKKELVAKGADLKAGGRIKMVDGEMLSLKTPMGDSIVLSGATYMKLDDLDSTKGATKVSLELFKGIATNKVSKLGPESSFSIRTPSAVAGVRGTEFQVAVSETGETEVDVMEGEVGVAANDAVAAPVPVTAGKSAKVKKGGGISLQVVKNIKKRASSRAARAAKVKQASSAAGASDTSKTDGSSGSDAGNDGASSATESDTASSEEVVVVEGVDTEAITESINEEVDSVVEEVNNEIQQDLDEGTIEQAVEEAQNAAGDINVELESINR